MTDACAGWAGPPAASSWRTQLSLSWGNQRQFDEVLRAVVKVGDKQHFFRLGVFGAARSCFLRSVSGSRPISGRAAFESRKPKRGFKCWDMFARRVGGADASERENGFGRAVKHLRRCTRAAQLQLPFVVAACPPYNRNTLLS